MSTGGPVPYPPPPPPFGARPPERDSVPIVLAVGAAALVVVLGLFALTVYDLGPRPCSGCPAIVELPVTVVFVNDSEAAGVFEYNLEIVSVGAGVGATFGIYDFGFTTVNGTAVVPTSAWSLTISTPNGSVRSGFTTDTPTRLAASSLPVIAPDDRLALVAGTTFLGGGTISLYAHGPTWVGGASLSVPYAPPTAAVVFAK